VLLGLASASHTCNSGVNIFCAVTLPLAARRWISFSERIPGDLVLTKELAAKYPPLNLHRLREARKKGLVKAARYRNPNPIMAGFMGAMTGMGGIFHYAFNSLDMTSSANDIVVVQHSDGTLHSSPFTVRFGRVKVLRPQDKVVTIEVNGKPTSAVMKIASDGTAYWVHSVADSHRGPHDVDSPIDSPLPQSPIVGPESPDNNSGVGSVPPLRYKDPEGTYTDLFSGLPQRREAPAAPPHAVGVDAAPATQQEKRRTSSPPPGEPKTPPRDEATRRAEAGMPPAGSMPEQVKRLDDAAPEDLLRKSPVEGLLTSLAAEAANSTTPPPCRGTPSMSGERRPIDRVSSDMDVATPAGSSLGSSLQTQQPGLRLARLASADMLDQLNVAHVSLTGLNDDHRSEHTRDAEAKAAIQEILQASPDEALELAKSPDRTAHAMHKAEDQYPAVDDAVPVAKEPRTIADRLKDGSPDEKYTTAKGQEAKEDLVTAKAAKVEVAKQHLADEDVFSDSEHDEEFTTNPAAGIEECLDALSVPTGHMTATESPNVRRSVFATHHDLLRLNLKPGANKIVFSTGTTLRGRVDVTATIFLWSESAKLVISDVDGTITKSDVMGHIATFFGKDWTHPGLTSLYSKIQRNGYHFVYLTARSLSQVEQTRQFLMNVEQDGVKLPLGPVFTAPDKLFSALQQELTKKSHEFKIACLAQIRDAFPTHVKPFYAGFGNRIGDVVAYTASEISEHKIFVINKDSVIHICSVKRSYRDLSHMVDETFPARRLNDDYLEEYYEARQTLDSASSFHGTAAPESSGERSPVNAAMTSSSLPRELASVLTLPSGNRSNASPGPTSSAGDRSSSPNSDTDTRHSATFPGPGSARTSASPATTPSLSMTQRQRQPATEAVAEFNDFNFWRVDPMSVIEPKPANAKKSEQKNEQTVTPTKPDRPSGSARTWLGGLWPKKPPPPAATGGGPTSSEKK
jgi:phosphatidate phosphatase PAH1